MFKQICRVGIVGGLLLFAATAQAKTSPDYSAGYHDGCTSSKGNYTRSAYKYRHSGAYHRGWRKGKRSCRRYRSSKRKVHRASKHYTKNCTTEVPWVAFRKGWDDGYRSAKGKYYRNSSGCAAYRRGWVNGYRSCHCAVRRTPDSYTEGYYSGCTSSAGDEEIMNEGYYQTSPRYRKGWREGYNDCLSL